MSDASSQDDSFSALLDDQRRHWRSGERYLVEAYLEQYPRLLSDRMAILALIHSEIELRRELGENPQPDEYLRRFPQLDKELRQHFGITTLSAEPPAISSWPSTASHPLAASLQPLQPTESFPSIPGYEIQQLIDSGGQGEVYKARHIILDRIVALKLLRDDRASDAERLARFRREGKVIARSEHPQIVRVHDFGESGGRLFLSMEYLAGGTLKDRLAKSGPWEPQAAIELLLVLTDAVENAHQKGIVHRDLKPGNVLFTVDGHPKVADFGLAKILDDNSSLQTRTDAILGSPSYMAPEQAAGRISQIGPATDVYALGAILYEVLTGRPPFRGESWLHTLDMVRTQPTTTPTRLRPGIPLALEQLCLKCLEKDVKDRYSSVAGLAAALRKKAFGEGRRDTVSLPLADSARTTLEGDSAAAKNPQAVLHGAFALAQLGRYEDALRSHLWFHEHALAHNPALAGVRLSYALAGWVELGKKYPPALKALVSDRDDKAKAIIEGRASSNVFLDVAAINQSLDESPKTVALFRAMHEASPKLAGSIYHVVEPYLVAQREYAVCAAYIPNALARFEEIRQLLRVQMEIADENPALRLGAIREYAASNFVTEVSRLLEILMGVGRKDEAKKVLEAALAECPNPESRDALTKAIAHTESQGFVKGHEQAS
jgi:serine/threonine-protein kinase